MVNGGAMKICVVGPPRVGKTYMCKLAAEQTLPPPEYKGTSGVRIQEVERNVNGERCRVQLWDCSGDPRFERLVPGMAHGVMGLIMVYDAAVESEAEMEKWYQAFAQPAQLATSQVVVVAVSTNGATAGGHSMKGKLSRLRQVHVALPEGREDVPAVLNAIDGVVVGILSRKKDTEETQIVEDSEF